MNELHLVFERVVSVQEEVKALSAAQAKLAEQVATLITFMVRAQTLEDDRKLPVKVEELNQRVKQLENGDIAWKNQMAGQLRTVRWIAAVVGFAATVFGLWQTLKAIGGH